MYEQPSTIPTKRVPLDRTRGTTEDWLEEVRTAIRNQQILSSHEWGNTTLSETFDITVLGLQAVATTPVSMRIKVGAGAGYIDTVPVRLAADWTSTDLVAPTTYGRIDSVFYDGSEQGIVIVTGTESATPTAPSAGDDQLLLAWVHHRVGETGIYNTNTSGEGYIEDKRILPA